jgi:hypothetical protein
MATAPVFRGYATITGIAEAATFDCLIAGPPTSSVLIQSAKGTQEWDEEVIKDSQGYDALWIMRNEREMLDIDMFIVGTSAAIAAVPFQASGSAGALISALGTAPFLGPGSILTLSGFIPTAFNGVFRVMSGGATDLTNTTAWKYSLKLLKYASSAQNTAMAVIPS